jgi:hypothetical protein
MLLIWRVATETVGGGEAGGGEATAADRPHLTRGRTKTAGRRGSSASGGARSLAPDSLNTPTNERIAAAFASCPSPTRLAKRQTGPTPSGVSFVPFLIRLSLTPTREGANVFARGRRINLGLTLPIPCSFPY